MNSDPGFRAARKAGARGTFGMVFPLLFLGFLVFFAGSFASDDGSGAPTAYVVVAWVAAVIVLLIFVRGARRWARNRAAWSRAARGAVSLTLRGEAVAAERTVSGRPMRTVVVEHRGKRQYLHLLFAPGAKAKIPGPGWVTVEFFAGDDAEGPARLTLADGRTLWAFSSSLGAAVAQPRSRARRSTDATPVGADDGGLMVPAAVVPGLDDDHGRGDDRPGDPDPSPSPTENGGSSNTGSSNTGSSDTGSSSSGSSSAGSSSAGASTAAASGAAASSAVWAGGDGWTGGSSWGGDPTWSGSDGGSGGGGAGGSDGGGGGWFSGGGDSGGWGGGDSGGGGGDSGGGS
ncbi:hypothetical protein GCM10010413_31920 [Promicromonospora sukumoe]|uniref:Putative membrane protein YgcG n=1 Tax=Promicromonospora sukumoe TaxID=88382 RepID=A0A7W3J7Z5_9MICO|nr:hypothetical protein [Promicromonospora sukumoe]MBA8807946.1 putative membrane protein YgcG [Promicromonospora sukumoe]